MVGGEVMDKILRKTLPFVLAVFFTPAMAVGGWIAEWKNTPIRNGERLDSELSTIQLSKNKARIEQPHIISVYDYKSGKMLLLNPKSRFFWSGKVEDYTSETRKNRNKALKGRLGKGGEDVEDDDFDIDIESLPGITIERTDESKEIAGHNTHKYTVHANDELFQEIWLAEGLDVASDRNVDRYLAYQRESAKRMIGKSAGPYNALYRSPEYKGLLEKGFALQIVIHHIAGGFERQATSIRQADVPEAEFEVPDDYRRVRLGDVFPKDEDS
jgi:hypothetical protein